VGERDGPVEKIEKKTFDPTFEGRENHFKNERSTKQRERNQMNQMFFKECLTCSEPNRKKPFKIKDQKLKECFRLKFVISK
jgi:hypothetical protein